MRRRRGIAVAVACCAVVGGWSAGLAAAEIGGPPTNDYDRCDSYSKPCGEPLVLAEGSQFNGRREIVGLESEKVGTCLFFESIDVGFAAGTCDESVNPRPNEALRIEYVSRGKSPGQPGLTSIGGVLRPDVAAVRVRYRRRGTTRVGEAISGQLDPQLAKAVGGKGRFGVFDFVCRGQIRFKRFRVQAFDSEGRLLAVERSPF